MDLIKRGEKIGDPVSLVPGYMCMAPNCHMTGQFLASKDYAEKVIQLYDLAEDEMWRLGYAQDLKTTASSWRIWDLWSLGYLEQAIEAARDLEARLAVHKHAYSRAFSGSCLVCYYSDARDTQSAMRMAQEMLALCTEHGFEMFMGLTALWMSGALIDIGQAEKAVNQIQHVMKLKEPSGARVFDSWYLIEQARGFLILGKLEEGLDALVQADDYIQKSGEKCCEADFYRVRGDLLLAKGADLDEVETQYRKAIQVAQGQSAKSRELRAVLSLARLWKSQGRSGEAHELVEELYSWFREGFDTPDLKEARILLGECEEITV